MPERVGQPQPSGHCIRCAKAIPLNADSPLCDDCYAIWAEIDDEDASENYCHSCGKDRETSYAKPLCTFCYGRVA